MWAYGVNMSLGQGQAPDNGFKVTENMYNLNFESVTGTVVIDGNGDRLGSYKVKPSPSLVRKIYSIKQAYITDKYFLHTLVFCC